MKTQLPVTFVAPACVSFRAPHHVTGKESPLLESFVRSASLFPRKLLEAYDQFELLVVAARIVSRQGAGNAMDLDDIYSAYQC